MGNIVDVEYLLCERVEEILKKKTALTPDDINAVKELSTIIAKLTNTIVINFAQIRSSENRCASAGRSGRASQRLSKEN